MTQDSSVSLDGQVSGAVDQADPEVTYELPVGQDWLLTQLINWAEVGIKPGITVYVGGQVISGTACPEHEYLESLRKGYADGLIGSAVADTIDDTFAIIVNSLNERNKAEGAKPYPEFIHIGDAKVFIPGQDGMPGGEGAFMRIKLASVDGFSLGKLGPAK